jgi:ArsR family transcriptional regulator
MAQKPTGHPLSDRMAELVAKRFAALAEPIRIRMLDTLREQEEASVSDLAEIVGTTHANASKHLNLLYAEGIVARRKDKTKTLYRIADPAMFKLCDAVCDGLEQKFRELGEVFEPPRSSRRAVRAA